MRKRTIGALTAMVVVAAMTAAPMRAGAQTVDEIVAKHLATKGGPEKWKSVQTQKMTGVAISEGFELALTVYAKRPNVARQELVIELPGQPPVTIVTVFDGTKAWMANPMTGNPAPVEMPAGESSTVKAQSDFDGALIDYQSKGYTVTLLDPAAVAGKKALHLRVSRDDLPTQHVYLDPDTFVELRVSTEGVSMTDTDLSDYRSIDGIMVPHSIKILQGGTVQAELKINKVEFNTPMDDGLFRVK